MRDIPSTKTGAKAFHGKTGVRSMISGKPLEAALLMASRHIQKIVVVENSK